MKKTSKNKGITLIALVITIIVLLILAGISISTLTGENGVLTRAGNAKEQTEIEEAKEHAKVDISIYVTDKIAEGKSTKLNDIIIQGILTGKDYVSKEEGQPGEHSFKTYNGGHEIPYSELYVQKKIKVTLSHSSYPVVSGTYILDEGATWSDLIEIVNPIGDWDAFRIESSIALEGDFVSAPYDGGMAYPYYDYIEDTDGSYIRPEMFLKSRCLSIWPIME